MPVFMYVALPYLGRFLFYVFEYALYGLVQVHIGVYVFCMYV
jgi:hypothetical protein